MWPNLTKCAFWDASKEIPRIHANGMRGKSELRVVLVLYQYKKLES